MGSLWHAGGELTEFGEFGEWDQVDRADLGFGIWDFGLKDNHPVSRSGCHPS
jgi:hypothetical protein